GSGSVEPGERCSAGGRWDGIGCRGAGTVKGNINRDGEKIYHLPGDPAYERTHAERMFASAAAAEAAGYRRAGQRHTT
ncbi:MAG: MBL fold metallo-hydrolase, partial [Dehalococcoidia bacterium]